MNNSHGTSAGPAPCSHLSFAVGDPDIRRYGLGAVALRLAAMGLPSFPLKPGGKEPVIPSAHPPGDPLRGRCHGECGRLGHGLYDATTDPAVITGPDFWGDGHKSRNIGIRTDRLLVADLDVKGDADGFVSWRAFQEDEDLWLPEMPYQDTPSGGRHLLFRLPDGVAVQSRNGVLPGVDIKSAGGYILAWPSALSRRPRRSPGDVGPPRRHDWVHIPYEWSGCPCQAPVAPPELIEALGRLHGTSAGGGGHGGGGGGWTDPDIPALIAAGIPKGVTQRPVLRDVVWKMVMRGCADAEIRGVWRQIVARTTLTDPSDPWTEYHFRLQLDSARAKPRTELPAPPAEGVQSLIPAGSDVCHDTDGVVHDKRCDQRRPPDSLKSQPQVRAKVKAETRHFHPASRDNDNCPAGWREDYAGMAGLAVANATTWAMGAPTCEWEGYARLAGCVSAAANRPAGGVVFDPDQPEARGWGASIRWSLKGGECGVPLLEQLAGGWLRLLGDTEHAREEWVCPASCTDSDGFSAVHSAKNCPNVEPGTCPRFAGDVVGDKLPTKDLVLIIRTVLPGLTHYWVAALVNHAEFRRDARWRPPRRRRRRQHRPRRCAGACPWRP